MEKKADFTSLEVLARLTGTPMPETRELVDRWLLLTYDLPHNQKGDKARREFLVNARMIGATRHTDSVYLMPWTKTAEVLALQLARAGGDLCVWTSQTTEEDKAREITRNYDQGIEPVLDEISGRVDRIEEHMNHRRFKRAQKMMDKTERMLTGIEQALIRRGSAELFIYLTLIKRRLQSIF